MRLLRLSRYGPFDVEINLGLRQIVITGNASCYMYSRSCGPACIDMCSVFKQAREERTCLHASPYGRFDSRCFDILIINHRIGRAKMFAVCKSFRFALFNGDPHVCPTRLETRTKEFNVCASLLQRSYNAQYMWSHIYCKLLPAYLFEHVWVWAYALGPERWWTVPVKGEVWGNSGGSPSWYWRANRSLYIGIGAKD